MAKLKFDRSINISIDDSEGTTVPRDEVWKGTLAGTFERQFLNSIEISGQKQYVGNRADSTYYGILGGVLKSQVNAHLQGLHSRLLANIFAKEVSLA